MFLFVLSKFHLEMAAYEVLSVAEPGYTEQKEDLLLLDDAGNYERLAFTNKVIEVIIDCPEDELEESISGTSFEENDYCVRCFGNETFSTRQVASWIYNAFDNPRVNLDSPSTEYEVHFRKGRVFLGKVLWKNDKDFLERKAHMRPELHPSSIDPRVARAAVNMTGAKDEVLDPFCGSGGLLIEAGLMGLKAVGFDIDDIMLRRAEINLKHYGVDYELYKQDALSFEKGYDHVVTDPPYGKNTGAGDLKILYQRFLDHLSSRLGERAVLIHPGLDLDFSKFNVLDEFSYRIHKSMNRHIVVLEQVTERKK
ncbi:MAG: methyltransferase domain-containing protein [Nanobdellota archaeon]